MKFKHTFPDWGTLIDAQVYLEMIKNVIRR